MSWRCLNPYCYGIPSQRRVKKLSTQLSKVLILIVMEYLLRAKAAGKTSVNDFTVLILIVMEYLLRDQIEDLGIKIVRVLILIVMEYLLRVI